MHKIWMLDLAREQSPTLDHLYQYATVAQESGFSLGLYLEHRFAYPSHPEFAGLGAVTPRMIEALCAEFPSLEIIPFINVLGHVEGFLYAAEGQKYREETFKGLQACPSNPDFLAFCQEILADVISIFPSQLVHIGGDETSQLGKCEQCRKQAESLPNGIADLYSRHLTPLIDQVLAAGKCPAVWGDIFLEQPAALENLSQEAVIFDWQYRNGLQDSADRFGDRKVYGCPTLHVYNSPWMHISESEHNIRSVASDAHKMGLEGICLTTWEAGLFGCFDTQFPAIKWAGKIADKPEEDSSILDSFADESGAHREWAKIMGVDIPSLGGVFAHSMLRHPLKCRLLLYSNPFLITMHHGEALVGELGKQAIQLADQAMAIAPDEPYRNASAFVRSAVEFAILSQRAKQFYDKDQPESAIGQLTPLRGLFDDLAKLAKQNHHRIGGSQADFQRCIRAKKHVEEVISRIQQYGHRELGYLPAFDVITNPRFMPHDQGCWWLINQWANE